MTLPVISRALLLLPVVSLLVQSGHGQINLLKQKPTSSQSGVVTRTVPDSVTPVETMAVDVDPTAQNTLATALPGTTLTLDLLPGHSFTALLENFNQNPDELHAYTWTGPIIEAPDAEFILSTYNSVTVASIALADGDIYSITYNGDGTHQVTKSHPVLNHVCGVDDHMHPPLQPAPTTPGVRPMAYRCLQMPTFNHLQPPWAPRISPGNLMCLWHIPHTFAKQTAVKTPSRRSSTCVSVIRIRHL